MFLIVVLYALCATTFTISKAALQYVQPLFFVGSRMLIAGSVLMAYLWLRKPEAITFSRKHIWLFVQIVLFHIYIAYVFDLWALQYITSCKSSLFFNLSPFIAAFFSYLLFKERLSSRKLLGLAIGCIGFIPQLLMQGNEFTCSLADLVMLGAVASAAYGWIVMRALMNEGYSFIFVNAVAMLGGGVLALITSAGIEGISPLPITDVIGFAKTTMLIVVVANLLFYNLYGFLLKRYSPTFLSFAGFMTPLVAALFGAVFLGESISWNFLMSFGTVSCGLFLFYQDELAAQRIAHIAH